MTLHDPDRHEALRPQAWDERRVRATIARIVDATTSAFSVDGWWAPHPRDLEPGDDPARPELTLYHGAAGVVWALDYLRMVGAVAPTAFTAPLAALHRATLAALPRADAGSYLMGELPVAMMAWGHAPTPELADRIEALIAGNIDHPARELMWGAPGSLLAAALMQGRDGDARWTELFRRIAARLHEQLEWSSTHGCQFWSQALYGRRSTYLDAVHGFVATASALIKGRHLLRAGDWSPWQGCIERTIAATVVREQGRATWPFQIEAPFAAQTKRLMQFCHGAPGFVICLAHLPGNALDALLVEAGTATWAAGPLAKGSNLCHGTAGNGYAFLALHVRTGDARWLARARAFAMHAIDQFEAEWAATGRLRHSLWTGDVGLAVYLWDCLRAQAAFPTLDVFFGVAPDADGSLS